MSGPFGAPDEHLVAQHIELLLRFTLHVDAASGFCVVVAGHTAEFPAGDGAGNGLAGDGHVQYQCIEIAAGLRKPAPLLDQKLRQCGEVGLVHGSVSLCY